MVITITCGSVLTFYTKTLYVLWCQSNTNGIPKVVTNLVIHLIVNQWLTLIKCVGFDSQDMQPTKLQE
jgi:hypothetical protein